MKKSNFAVVLTIFALGIIPFTTSAETTIGAATGGLTQGTAADNALVGEQCKQILRSVYHGSEPIAQGIGNLNPDFACRLSKYIQASPGCTIRSAWRSAAHQAALFAKSDGSGHMVAKNSNHTKGIAADLQGPCTATNHKVSPEQFGLWFRMSWEPWHIEPNGAVVGGGAQTGDTSTGSAGNSSGSTMPNTGGATSGSTAGSTGGSTSGGTNSGSTGTSGAQQQLIYPSTNQGEDGGLSSDAEIKSLIGTSTYDSLITTPNNSFDGTSPGTNLGAQPFGTQSNTGDTQTPQDQSPANTNATPGSTNNSYTSPDMNDSIDPAAATLANVFNTIRKALINIIAQLTGQ